MGWVDHDALWCFDVPGRKVRLIPLNSGADRVKVHTAGPDRFSLAYDFKGSRFELTVHNFSGPLRVVARATLTDTLSEVTAELEQMEGRPALACALSELRAVEGFRPSENLSDFG